jgi:hypothetical protein
MQLRSKSKRFVLIGGMPRSGTTLIETVIGSHSRIAIPPGDFPFAERASTGLGVDEIFSIFRKKQTWELWRVQDFSSVFDLSHGDAFRATLIQYAEGISKDIPGAKAPFSEFYIDSYLDWLADDELKFVYVLRNPFDVLASLKHSYIHTNWRVFRDLIEVQSRNWLRSVSVILAREHADPQRFYVVRYEDFVRNPANAGSRLCEFLGVDFEEEDMLNRSEYTYHDTNTSFPDRFAEREDKTTYIYEAGSRKLTLSSDEVDLVSRVCGETALSLGYEDPDFSVGPPEHMQRFDTLNKIRRLPRRVYRKVFS